MQPLVKINIVGFAVGIGTEWVHQRFIDALP
jgi:hypothetical protein